MSMRFIIDDETLDRGVDIYIDGFGTLVMDEGYGPPLRIERRDGKTKLYVWEDINREDPTSVIPLDGARESARHLNLNELLQSLSLALGPAMPCNVTGTWVDVHVPLTFQDGDCVMVAVVPTGDGGLVLTDLGSTCVRREITDKAVEAAGALFGVRLAAGGFELPTSIETVGKDVFTFVQAMLDIDRLLAE